MKKLWLVLFGSALLCGLFVGFGCSSSSNGTTNPDTFDLFTTVESAGPVVTPTAVAGSVVSPKATWSSGNNLYEIFYLIREYVNSRDNGVIDGSNMYKAMYDSTAYVDEAFETCAASEDNNIPDQSITSPFNFGDDLFTQTYDCAFTTTETSELGDYVKSFASKHADNLYYTLMGWHVTSGTTTTPQVYQTQYDSSTNTIKVNSAYLVDYADQPDYAVRIHINGNTETGLFALRLFKYDGGGTTISIAGYGYSRDGGAGADHYLFRVTSTGTGADVTDAYFCFASATTQAEMEAMSDAGSVTVPTDCTALEEGLPDNLVVSEVPTTTADFTGGGATGIELSWTE